jgi:D-glycero-D-manno-heptose 1,7-bisphosphate phosphatase
MGTAHGRAAAFLDRDGVLNELVPDPVTGAPESPLSVDDVRLVSGAAAAAARLMKLGFVLVCVSNQPAAAKGTVPLERLLAVHERVLALLREAGIRLDASRLCLHHPEGVVAELTGPCDCRKPAPGMLLDAAEELDLDLASSWIVGDTDSDVAAGKAAGCRTMLIEHQGSVHKRLQVVNPDVIAASLADGVAEIGLPRSETNR